MQARGFDGILGLGKCFRHAPGPDQRLGGLGTEW